MNRIGSRHTWRWLAQPAVDFLLFYVGLATTLIVRQPGYFNLDTGLGFFPLFIFWLAAIYTLGLYDVRSIRDTAYLVRNLFLSAVTCMGLGTTYFYYLGSLTLTPKTHLLLTVLISHALILAWRKIWLVLLKYNILDQRFVFLVDPSDLSKIEKELPHHLGDTGLISVPWQWPGVDSVVADGRWVDRNWDSARAIFLAAIVRGVPIITLEDFYESVFGKVSPHYAGNPSWALKHILPNNSGFHQKFKRIVDCMGAAVLLLASSPIFAAAAALIVLIDGRPIFYRQSRAGFLGKPFRILKFRTMLAGSEAHGPFTSALAHKSSITPLGAVLRRFRLDELPQLWNVLIGEMSLVGPRPEWTQEVAVLEKVVPSYHLRHLVKPGITGWAQVRFRATNSVDDSIEKIHFDLYYLKFLSLGLDVSILLKTIKRVFTHDSKVKSLPTPAVMQNNDFVHWAGDLATSIKHL
ncbi:MAG: sugar transferase [Elusimicrobiota bacterium]